MDSRADPMDSREPQQQQQQPPAAEIPRAPEDGQKSRGEGTLPPMDIQAEKKPLSGNGCSKEDAEVQAPESTGLLVDAGREPAEDGDKRLDPMAHSFPWAQWLIPPNLRTIDPEAAFRVPTERKLHMLPFKCWVRHGMIAAELDNGPSRVWLRKHPLSSRDFVLDPVRVAKSSICWHRFIRCHFMRTMMMSLAVIFSSVLAMYIAISSFAYSLDLMYWDADEGTGWLRLPKFQEGVKAINRFVAILAIAYPVITTYLVMSISWEYAMRRELYYLLLQYKIIVDMENLSWTPCRRFAKGFLTEVFVYWTALGSLLLIVWAFTYQSAISIASTVLLSVVPLYSWWSETVQQEWTFVALNKFMEMKRDAGEGMDLSTGLEFLQGCKTVPETTLRAVAASLNANIITGCLKGFCPLPSYVAECCLNKTVPDKVPGLLDALIDEGETWWAERTAYEPETRFPRFDAKGSCSTGSLWARSHWGSYMMQKVLPYCDDLWEIRHLINQFNCWCGCLWVILMWAAFGAEVYVAVYLSSAAGQASYAEAPTAGSSTGLGAGLG